MEEIDLNKYLLEIDADQLKEYIKPVLRSEKTGNQIVESNNKKDM